MNEVRNILLGIEISRDNAQLCYYDRSLKEPVSIPVKVGSNLCSFPMLLVKMKGKDEWHFGFEARFFEQQENGISVPNPYTVACSDERTEVDGREMEPYEPLAVFIREALCLLGLPHPVQSLSGICVTCPDLQAVLAQRQYGCVLPADRVEGHQAVCRLDGGRGQRRASRRARREGPGVCRSDRTMDEGCLLFGGIYHRGGLQHGVGTGFREGPEQGCLPRV